jgi:hypothetical protein
MYLAMNIFYLYVSVRGQFYCFNNVYFYISLNELHTKNADQLIYVAHHSYDTIWDVYVSLNSGS